MTAIVIRCMAATDPKQTFLVLRRSCTERGLLKGKTMGKHADLTRGLSALLIVLAIPLSLNATYPEGWFLAGSTPDDFETDLVEVADHAGHLKSVVENPGGFGTAMRMFSAEGYRGKRLMFSSAVKTHAVSKWAGIWMRIDGPSGERLGFDNMQNRPISGSTEWGTYEVVLDIPQGSHAIAFGVLLVGAGEVFVSDLQLREVSEDTPLTAYTQSSSSPE